MCQRMYEQPFESQHLSMFVCMNAYVFDSAHWQKEEKEGTLHSTFNEILKGKRAEMKGIVTASYSSSFRGLFPKWF